jgi:hypothetical protein
MFTSPLLNQTQINFIDKLASHVWKFISSIHMYGNLFQAFLFWLLHYAKYPRLVSMFTPINMSLDHM